MGNHHAFRVIAPTIKELFLAERANRPPFWEIDVAPRFVEENLAFCRHPRFSGIKILAV
jgi:hypothetical protein